MNDPIPISRDLVRSIAEKAGIPAPGKASIREIVALVNRVEKETGIPFVRMEMGVPGVKPPEIAIEAEIAALKQGVASVYPPIEGVASLKQETSRFLKLFLDVDIDPAGCIPTCGSMQGSCAAFLTVNRTDRSKEGTLFIDPGFPVHKQQCHVLGHDFFSFDIYDYRGEKLRDKLESYFKTGKISSLLYSNPNNPSWICLNEEELSIVAELADRYDVVVIEDLAYFGMDFRNDISKPGVPPFQPTIAKYTDNYILLFSSSKVFSYAGQRIAMMAVSDKLFTKRYPDLLRYYTSDVLGHTIIYGALYALSAGASHSAQIALASVLKASSDGIFNPFTEIRQYGERAMVMKRLFTGNGFRIVYDMDLDVPIADGFYFTISYPGYTGSQLLEELLYYGISAITLDITGSTRTEGLRACVSQVGPAYFPLLEERLQKFSRDHA
ncbi:MAG: pyridoxal phosphate-dependent aminotransferase [Bacteroidales bacterium]|nr:pyridoxal phosphate-dependent aminotransferase [Bacteroidales bacterium]